MSFPKVRFHFVNEFYMIARLMYGSHFENRQLFLIFFTIYPLTFRSLINNICTQDIYLQVGSFTGLNSGFITVLFGIELEV